MASGNPGLTHCFECVLFFVHIFYSDSYIFQWFLKVAILILFGWCFEGTSCPSILKLVKSSSCSFSLQPKKNCMVETTSIDLCAFLCQCVVLFFLLQWHRNRKECKVRKDTGDDTCYLGFQNLLFYGSVMCLLHTTILVCVFSLNTGTMKEKLSVFSCFHGFGFFYLSSWSGKTRKHASCFVQMF